jgi:zinc transporter, ZIP family
MQKAIEGFSNAGFSDMESYRYATLAFFGGFLLIFLLDKVVHCLVDLAARRGSLMSSPSRAKLLSRWRSFSAKIATSGARGSTTDLTLVAAERGGGLEAMAAKAAVSAVVLVDAPRQVPPMDHAQSADKESDPPSSGNGSDQGSEHPGAAPAAASTPSREMPAVVEILTNDPHNFALKKMGMLTAVAIAIHNFPEGLATFVAALADTKVGVGIAVAIAMHNIPEGICVAMPIYYATGSKWKGFLWGLASGLSEPLGALVGWAVLSDGSDLAFGLVFALVGGMMVYISIKELIPTALKYDPKDRVVTTAVVCGMIVMAASLMLFALA